jgi:hypothetical protein
MTTRKGARIPIGGLPPREANTQNRPGTTCSLQDQLIKQTYSVWAPTSGETRETRKWHLGESDSDLVPSWATRILIVVLNDFPVAYFTSRSLGWLATIDRDSPQFAWLQELSKWSFRPARTTRGRGYGGDTLHANIVTNQPHQNHHHDGAESWPSPAGSNSPGCERLPGIGYAVPSAPWRQPTWDERLGVEIIVPPPMARQLAPLKYLQSISPPPRQPLDDFAIRAFDAHGV